MTNYATTSGIDDQTAGGTAERHRPGPGIRRVENRRLLLSTAGGVHQPRVPTRAEAVPLAGRHAARMIITHDVDPATPEGISHIDAIRHAAQEAIKGTPLAGSRIYLAGTAATYKDIQDGAKYDLVIAGIAALSLILLIMMFITRSLVAAIVIVGTVALSLGASFGLSVLIWQDLLRYRVVLDRAGAGRHPAVGRGVGLQPVADLAVQGGDRRRLEDGHHPRDGRLRRGGDRRRSGVRGHHGLLRVRRSCGFSVRSGPRSPSVCCSTH